MNSSVETLKGLFLATIGSGGTVIAAIQPWQEHLEWAGRMSLLGLSMLSVAVGLWITLRKKTPPPPLD